MIFETFENEIDYLVMDVFFEVDKGILYYNNGKIMTNAKGFEDIKRDCRNQIEAFIQKEEGRKIIRDILFTNTIWE